MVEHIIPDELLTLLREVDTPIVCDAIEVAQGRRGFVHVVEIGTPVNVFGITVAQGELIHADRHGALVIPQAVIVHLKAAIETVIANEAIVIGPAREPGFTIDKLEEAWAAFEAART